jgi:hypothetical protein
MLQLIAAAAARPGSHESRLRAGSFAIWSCPQATHTHTHLLFWAATVAAMASRIPPDEEIITRLLTGVAAAASYPSAIKPLTHK